MDSCLLAKPGVETCGFFSLLLFGKLFGNGVALTTRLGGAQNPPGLPGTCPFGRKGDCETGADPLGKVRYGISTKNSIQFFYRNG